MTEHKKPELRRALKLLAKERRTTPKRIRKSLKKQGLLNYLKQIV